MDRSDVDNAMDRCMRCGKRSKETLAETQNSRKWKFKSIRTKSIEIRETENAKIMRITIEVSKILFFIRGVIIVSGNIW